MPSAFLVSAVLAGFLVACRPDSSGSASAPGPTGSAAAAGAGDGAVGSDAGAAPGTPGRGTPVVISDIHAIRGAIWRPNGHLLARTDEELLDIDVAHPESIRRIPTRSSTQILGSPGAPRFALLHATFVQLFDATTLAPIAEIETDADIEVDTALSEDASVLAFPRCLDGKCRFVVFDAATGKELAVAPVADPKNPADPGTVTLAPNGHWLEVQVGRSMVIADAHTGKVMLQRKVAHLTEGGGSQELVELRDDTLYVTSTTGLDVVRLSPDGPKVLHHAVDPKMDRDSDVTWEVAPDGSTVLETSLTGHSFTFAVPASARAASHAPPPPFAVDPSPGNRVCTLQSVADKRDVAASPLLCSQSAFTAPGLRPDHAFYAAIPNGTLHVFDTKTGARVFDLGDDGEPPVDMFRTLEFVDRVPRLIGHDRTTEPTSLWLTNGPLPTAPWTPDNERVFVRTRTNVFAVHSRRNGTDATVRELVAWDLAGHEVFRRTVAPFEDQVIASDGVAFLRTEGGGYLRCDLDAKAPDGGACQPFVLDGFIASFDNPWLLLGQRANVNDPPAHLRNLATGETRPMPATCPSAFGAKILRDGPRLVCQTLGRGNGGDSFLVAPDGTKEPIPAAPDTMVTDRWTLSARDESLFFYGRVQNDGLQPFYRYDARAHETVRLYAGGSFVLAQYPDKTVEIMGDRTAGARSIACATDDAWLPKSSCVGAFDTSGRFDKARQSAASGDAGRTDAAVF